jgi:Rad3-related DNA helicase
MGINLNKSIIIIDEAHNVMQAAESIIDIEIRHSEIQEILKELDVLKRYCNGSRNSIFFQEFL